MITDSSVVTGLVVVLVVAMLIHKPDDWMEAIAIISKHAFFYFMFLMLLSHSLAR